MRGDDDFSDAALPLDKVTHRNRRHVVEIRPRDLSPVTEHERERTLRAHCSKRGKRHEFVVQGREGVKCLWCGMTRRGE